MELGVRVDTLSCDVSADARRGTEATKEALAHIDIRVANVGCDPIEKIPGLRAARERCPTPEVSSTPVQLASCVAIRLRFL